MKKALITDIIQAGGDCGADFVEVFEEETREASVSFRDKKVESARAGTEYGIGIRLLYGTDVLYAFSSVAETDHLTGLVRQLAASRGASGSSQAPKPLSSRSVANIHPVKEDPKIAGQSSKLDLLRLADQTARSADTRISQVSASCADTVSDVLIANSQGLLVTDHRTRCRFSVGVTAESKGDIFVAGEAPGEMRGFEFFRGLDIAAYTQAAAQRALQMLSAGYIKGRKMPVVMGNGFGGVIFHEACGHPLETEAIRRKASFFVGKLGTLIANPKVTAIDDGTIPNGWGSSNIDDEGSPTQKTVLIKDGVLQCYMADMVGSKELGVPMTGSSRRESYKYAPVSRMRNTYIDSGSDTFEDMIASVDEGLYAKKMGGGSVNPATSEFNFAVEEGYIIRNGKIEEPVRGATLIGKGHEILPLISMVGNDLALSAGMCGAGSGLIPAAVGQPSLKVDSILVGGR